jgi:hypothetical protein
MAVAAVALDGGLLLDQRRRQVAADFAASDRYANYLSNDGAYTKGTAKASALAAAAHGYGSGSTNSAATADSASSVTVNMPPLAGIATGAPRPDHAEVVLQYNQNEG